MLSHRNLVANINSIYTKFDFLYNKNSRILSFLPWAHIYGKLFSNRFTLFQFHFFLQKQGQTAEVHYGVLVGSSIACSKSTAQLTQELKEAKPNLILGVPHVFNKVYNAMHNNVRESRLGSWMFDAALKAARQKHQLIDEGRSNSIVEMKYKLYDKLVLSKLRDVFGGLT